MRPCYDAYCGYIMWHTWHTVTVRTSTVELTTLVDTVYASGVCRPGCRRRVTVGGRPIRRLVRGTRPVGCTRVCSLVAAMSSPQMWLCNYISPAGVAPFLSARVVAYSCGVCRGDEVPRGSRVNCTDAPANIVEGSSYSIITQQLYYDR